MLLLLDLQVKTRFTSYGIYEEYDIILKGLSGSGAVLIQVSRSVVNFKKNDINLD